VSHTRAGAANGPRLARDEVALRKMEPALATHHQKIGIRRIKEYLVTVVVEEVVSDASLLLSCEARTSDRARP
jgi:hypothetical protein